MMEIPRERKEAIDLCEGRQGQSFCRDRGVVSKRHNSGDIR